MPFKKIYLNGAEFSNLEPDKEYKPERPPENSQIWRYINFAKFVSLLDRSALFLSRADLLGDSHEGSLSQSSEKRLMDWEERTGKPQAAAEVSRMMKLEQKLVFVNCWNELDHESDVMWNKYAREEDGVAVVTTFGSFIQSLGSVLEREEKNLKMGRVQYVDYDTEYVPEFHGMPYFHKRKHFAEEHEIRLVKWVEWKTNDSGHINVDTGIDDKNGLYLNVDISVLIHRVVVSPRAKPWFVDLVQSVANKYDLTVDVTASAMTRSPSWGAS